MTINECHHYTNRAEGTHYCTKCGRAWPQPCWEEQLSEAVSNGTPLQKEIMEELDDVLVAKSEATTAEVPTVDAEPERPTAPAPKARRSRSRRPALGSWLPSKGTPK